MDEYIITQEEIDENNVKSAPDQFEGEAEEAKHIFDKLPELIAEKFNKLVGYIKETFYTKAQTDAIVRERVQNIGAGDMSQTEYDSNEDGIVNSADNGIFSYIQTADGALSGSGRHGQFKAAVTQTVSAFDINGAEYAVNCAGESEIELIAGAWYTFVLDGDTINFNGGGGLSKSKFALATAAEENVTKGMTFYSQDKQIKTGKGCFGYLNGKYYLFRDGEFWNGFHIASAGKWFVVDGRIKVNFTSADMVTLSNHFPVEIGDFTQVHFVVTDAPEDDVHMYLYEVNSSGATSSDTFARGTITEAREYTVSLEKHITAGNTCFYISPRARKSGAAMRISEIYLT